VAALLARRFAEDVKFLRKNLRLPALLKRQSACFGGTAAVETRLADCVIRELFARHPLTADEFAAGVADLMQRKVHQQGQDLRDAVIAVIEAHHAVQCRILEAEQKRIAAPLVRAFLETLKAEAARLVPDNFVSLYDRQRLLHLVRYLDALAIRVARGLTDLAKDRGRQDQVAPYLDTLAGMLKSLDASTSAEKRAAVEDFFWAIEEYKVSLFAQEVGTDGPISPKRLKRMIGEIERMV
jgi:ATP-dependent helicase HrpA